MKSIKNNNTIKNDNKGTDIINKLIANQENISSAVIQAAVKAHQEKQAKEQEERVLGQLQAMSNRMNAEVTQLRNIREQEKKQKQRVLAFDAAMKQFMNDADYSAFQAAVAKVGIVIY